jgi:hypothetical protein
MASQPNRDAKTEAIYASARKIIEAESRRQKAKTDRLRALRLAKEAVSGPPEAKAPEPGARRARAKKSG